MFKNIFRKKNKYTILIETKNNDCYKLHQNFLNEALLDVYWAFTFGQAKKVEILFYNNKKNKKDFMSVEDFEKTWNKYFGNNTNYFVWYDRHVIEG